jgi:hypothetical protein
MSETTKTLEQLIGAGGRFFTMDGNSYCDTAIHMWRFDPARGVYVLLPDDDEGKEKEES